jgi:thiol-disulfide isomerase/thioredoxin
MKKWHIKRILKETAIGLFLLFVLSNVMSYLRKPHLESHTLPQIKSRLIDNTLFDTKSLKGKPVVIHFWATWCPTCKIEVANIQALSQKYELLSIAVASGSNRVLQRYMEENGLNFKVLNDSDGSFSKQFKVEAFPTTFIYDSKGELQFTEVGYTTTAGLLARMKIVD